MPLELSKVTADFDGFVEALVNHLQQSDAWKDTIVASQGLTLIDMIAGVGASNQFYIEMGAREGFPSSAVRESSVYAATRMLGVRISRKLPASVPCYLTNETSTAKVISPLSQFSVGPRFFFNRSQIVIPAGATVTAIPLYEGQIRTKEFDLATIPDLGFNEFHLNEPGFGVSDIDLQVTTYDLSTLQTDIWFPTEDSLFELTATQRVFFDNTTGEGDAVLTFGDGQFGRQLPTLGTLTVKYAVTEGAEASRSITEPKIKVTLGTEPLINGETSAQVSGGASNKPAIYYKLYGPNAFRARKRIISIADYNAVTNLYPGIADAVALGQRDIAPNDITYMNVIRICLLPEVADTMGGVNPNPQSQAWRDFLQWLEKKKHKAVQIQTWNPVKIVVSVSVTVAILAQYDPDTIRARAVEAIKNIFKRRPGTLGRRLAYSDISDVCKRLEGVDYVVVHNPTEDVVPDSQLKYVDLDAEPTVLVKFSERINDQQLI